jgi:protein phosphatase
MRPEVDFAGRQISGSRETQDDYYAFCPLELEMDGVEGLLLVLADGMGGYNGGATASRLVVEAFAEQFYLCRGSIPERLYSSLRAADMRLKEEISRREELSEMGSTLVGAVCTRGALHWASVGDSGLYLFRDGAVKRINADHSMAPMIRELVNRGEISEADAAKHPQRNVLRSALSREPLNLFEVTEEPFALAAHDIVLAASDGLASLGEEDLVSKLEGNRLAPASRIAEALLIGVNEQRAKKQDNATVAVVRPPEN